MKGIYIERETLEEVEGGKRVKRRMGLAKVISHKCGLTHQTPTGQIATSEEAQAVRGRQKP